MYTDDNAKTYTGTKTLKAWPATLGEYNAYRGWSMPEGEDPSRPGYLVEYEADTGSTGPNHPNHDGYVSWSPADVFEKTYFETPGDWKSRAAAELSQLSGRIEKLTDFLASAGADALPEDQRTLLVAQQGYMMGYCQTLAQRLGGDPA